MLSYNRKDYVDDAIKSIVNQTFKEFEFIVINNGSRDGSSYILKDWSSREPRIRLVDLASNIGIGAGRNRGLDMARGDYITFIDDDDIAEPDMLEFLYELAIENEADISICGSTKKVDGQTLPNYIFDDYMVMDAAEAVVEMLKRKKFNVAMPTKLMSKSLFNKIRFVETGNYDDITVGYKYLANADKVVAYGIPKYCFRRHGGNNSAFTTDDKLITPKQLDEYFDAFRERTDYLSDLLPQIGAYARYSEWSYMISMCNKIIINNLKDCHKQLEYIKDELNSNYDEFYNSQYIEDFEKEFMQRYIKGVYNDI